MDILAWIIGVLIAIILFGVVIMGLISIVEWLLEITHRLNTSDKEEYNER